MGVTTVADTYLTLEQVALLFHVSPHTVRVWVRDHPQRLPAPIRLGRRWLWEARAVREHVHTANGEKPNGH
jgi:hypothetical protein